jgi:cobalt-zinc-cadmium efflux system outer membrane protein
MGERRLAIVARLLTAVVVGTLGPAARAEAPGAVEALSEQAVVARALARAGLRDALAADVEAEEGRAEAARAASNPQVSYLREQTFGPSGTGEDYLSVAQVLDLGDRRALGGEAFEARARAARRDGEAELAGVEAEARHRFHEVLYRQGRIAELRAWLAQLDAALDIVGKRAQRGDAAVWDLRRIERERVVVEGRLEAERAALAAAEGLLAGLLGVDPEGGGLAVTGTLLPDGEPTALAALRDGARRRPELLALELRLEAELLDAAAASRWWVPDLRLEGGWKGVDLGPQGRVDGVMIGATLAFPLHGQARGLERAAEAQARALSGRRALLASELDGELAGAWAEAVQLRRAAVGFEARSRAVSVDLVRIASAGYAGGELGLLELLDALRGAADDRLTSLDLALAARRARVELDRRSGTDLP